MKIELVRFKPEYFEDFARWRKQPGSVAHNPLREIDLGSMFRGLSDSKTDLSVLSLERAQDFEEAYGFRWFIQIDDEKIVGNLSLKNISLMMGYGEIGYGIDEKFHNKGIATAAISILISKIFSETHLRKITALVHDQNIPSLRVLEKLGFQREGLLREHFLLNNLPSNEVYFGLLKKEWSAKKGTK